MSGTNMTDPGAPKSYCLQAHPGLHPALLRPNNTTGSSGASPPYGLSPYFMIFSTIASTSFLGGGVFRNPRTRSRIGAVRKIPESKGNYMLWDTDGSMADVDAMGVLHRRIFVFYIDARAEEKASIHTVGFFPDDIIFYVFLGLCGSLLMLPGIIFLCAQSIPHIVTTQRMKRFGSLSLPTLCMQVPGYLIWAVAIRGRYPPLMWALMPMAGALHSALLVLSLHLERERKRDERVVWLTGYEGEED
ncbi:hypothetical protein MMC29_002374 [Sticta canariensis]|nr:hypothetical protein [Sticta canariensis]